VDDKKFDCTVVGFNAFVEGTSSDTEGKMKKSRKTTWKRKRKKECRLGKKRWFVRENFRALRKKPVRVTPVGELKLTPFEEEREVRSEAGGSCVPPESGGLNLNPEKSHGSRGNEGKSLKQRGIFFPQGTSKGENTDRTVVKKGRKNKNCRCNWSPGK